MSKVRFQLNVADRWRKDMLPYFALDIGEVAVWRFEPDGSLKIWFKGISEPVYLVAADIGEENFLALIGILSAEFPDIKKLKFWTSSEARFN